MRSDCNLHRILALVLQILITTVYGQIDQNVFPADNLSNNSNDHLSVSSGISTTIDSSKWNINVVTQYGSDLRISLDSSVGFDSNVLSSINIIINGSTHQTLHANDHILFVFSVSNNKFFTTRGNLVTAEKFQIYPANNHPLASTNVNDLIYKLTPNRNMRYSENNIWHNTSLSDSVKWPMHITITNNPIQNIVTYKYRNGNNPNIITAIYNSSFTPNSAMNIDIAGDNLNTTFAISSINISYNSVPITTTYPKSTEPVITSTFANSILQTTQKSETRLKNTSSENGILGFHGYIGYIIIAVTFICAITCFVAGICIGIIYYKRTLNNNNNNEKEESDMENKPELEKQLSANDQFTDRFSAYSNDIDMETERMVFALSINIMNNMNETEESHESLYISDHDAFGDKNKERIDLTPQTSGHNNNNNNECKPIKVEPLAHHRTVTGEADILMKQKTLSNTCTIDNYTYNTLRVEYNVTDNNIYPDEGNV